MENAQTFETEIVNAAIAIFVKTPSLSSVKTRLAATLGSTAAQEFYLLSLTSVQETVKSANITPYWAVAEESGLDNTLWQSFPSLHTGEGDLGQRQHNVYETLLKRHERVLLIGADAPQLSKQILEQAILALDANDFVIGPARDGGYYLFGGRVATPAEIWTGVPWSTSVTRERLEAALPSAPFHLQVLTDVDTQDDLQFIEAEMPGVLSEQQKHLVEWAKDHAGAAHQSLVV